MDVILALILSCSVHYDDQLVEALAAKLSINNQYFVGDLSTLNTYDNAHSVTEAHQLVDKILAAGGRPAVGYLSVPVSWAARFGRTPDDLFDGCVNFGVATAMLSEYAHACTIKPGHRRQPRKTPHRSARLTSPDLRFCILRHLEVDLDITGVVEHVLPEVAKLDGKQRDPDDAPPTARAPLYPDNTNSARLHEPSDWSNLGLYFSPSPTAHPGDAGAGPTASAQRPAQLPPRSPSPAAAQK